MKKIKIILTSAVMVAALSFAYASKDVRRFDYFYYPGGNESGTPQPTTSTQECDLLQRGCTEVIAGESQPRQLFIFSNGQYRPVSKP